MRVINPLIIFLISCVQALPAFSQTNTVLRYLPDNPKGIIKINPLSLALKIKWQDLAKYKMFEGLVKQAPEKGKSYLSNPAQTGIDLGQGIFVVVPESKTNEKSVLVIYGTLKDVPSFAKMITELNPEIKPIKIGDGNILIDKSTVFAWNREIFIITGSNLKADTTNQDPKAKADAVLMKTKQLTEKCKTILTKRKIAFDNPQFLSLLKESGDMLLWTNNTSGNQASKNSKIPPAFGMLNKNLMRKGSFNSGVINFENGKVVMQMKQYVSPSIDSMYKKYPLRNINTGLLDRLPGGHPVFVCSFSFSPEMITESLAKSGADKMLDSMGKQHTNVKDILSAIKGDFLLAVMKVDDISPEDSVTLGMNGIQLFVAGSLNNKEKFKDISTLFQSKKPDSAKNNSAKKPKPLVLSDDSVFVVSLSQPAAQKFLAHSGSNEDLKKMFKPYKNNPSAALIDLHTVFGFAVQPMFKNKPEEEARQSAEVLGMFDKLVSYGGQLKDKFISTNMELTLVNKDENSLNQFIRLLNLFYTLKSKKSVAYN
ncbi:MAG TPA: DUF4836 family protein [Chitinophagaceae bacterium]|nr:DUF4836 family protein [Chitinophagaceae bacterium]